MENSKLQSLKKNAYNLIDSQELKGLQEKEYSQEEVKELLEELLIYQAELEAQNEELIQTQYKEKIANKKYKELFNNAPIIYMVLNPEGEIINFNDAAIEKFGLILTNNFTRKIHFAKLISQGIGEFLSWINNQDLDTLEIKLIGLHGVFWAKLEKNISFDTQLQENIFITIIDITQEKVKKEELEHIIDAQEMVIAKQHQIELLNQKLTEHKDQLMLIFDTLLEGVAVLDENLTFVHVNNAYCELLEYSNDEIIGKTCMDFTDSEDKQKAKEVYEEVLKSGYVKSFYRRCITKNGSVKTFETSIALASEGSYFIVSAVDRTSMIEQQEFIKQQDEQIMIQSKFASLSKILVDIGHHWRQPLTVISSAISGLQIKYEFDDLDKDFIEDISQTVNHNCQKLSTTIDDMRQFLEGDYSYETFDLKELVCQLIDLKDYSFEYNNILIKCNLDDPIFITNSKTGFTQVIINLLTNANDILKNCEQEKKFISIEVSDLGKMVQIDFYDNGGGVLEENLTKIFDPYFTTYHQTFGKGMGLSVVYSVVTKTMKGSISVENKFLEVDGTMYKGAHFTLLIPKNLELVL